MRSTAQYSAQPTCSSVAWIPGEDEPEQQPKRSDKTEDKEELQNTE